MPIQSKQQPPYYTEQTGIQLYKALLYQTGTNPPIPTIFQNTIGDITWTRNNTGIYIGTKTGSFTLNKIYINVSLGSQTSAFIIQCGYGIDEIELVSYDNTWSYIDIGSYYPNDGAFITIIKFP